MSKKLNVGDKVQCRLFDTPERKFYGGYFTGIILKTDYFRPGGYKAYEQKYLVLTDDGKQIALERKEIKKVISE